MSVQNPDTKALHDHIRDEEWQALPDIYARLHVQDIAEVVEEFPARTIRLALAQLPRERWTDVFSYLDTEQQYGLLDELDNETGRFILRDLSPDDLTALLGSRPATLAEKLLKLLSQSDLQQALKQLGYPEQSAGRLMTTQFVTLRPDWTLSAALEHLRHQGVGDENINTLYVLNRNGVLMGTVGLKRLIMQPPGTKVEDIVSGPLVSIQASEDRAEAAHLIQHYDITALPVVDNTGVMLGVVTVDDVLDVLEEENTEDFHKIGGMSGITLSLRDATPFQLYRKRIGWLVILVFVNIFGSAGIAYFEATIQAVIALVFFLPLIIGSGGNAGSQAATLMVRALGTGDVQARDWMKLWGKELGVATALGLTMGAAVWGLGMWRGGFEVALVVSLSMICIVLFGSMMGMVLPFLLTRAGLDPATASSPLITSIADIGGILIYFSLASLILTTPVT